MDPCNCYYNCILVHGCLIVCEIADKLVDLIVAYNYQVGNISNDPQDSVHNALMVFFVIGLMVSTARVMLYLWKIHLYRTDDVRRDKTHEAISLWMSLVKVWLEAFPQSTIAMFFFGHCALTDSIKLLVKVFDIFSIYPFIMFVCYAFSYCCAHEEGPNRATTFILAIRFILSIVGTIFAVISLNDFDDRCWPYND